MSANIIHINESAALAVHDEAMTIAKDFKTQYLKLFEILLVVEQRQLYFEFDVPSLYIYCVELLELSKDVAKDLIAVVRKSQEVPQLAEAIRSKKLTVPKARKICSVISEQNYQEWIDLAVHCSCRVVEKCVAMANPKESVSESLKYVSADIMEFKGGATEEWAEFLSRTKDIASQKRRTAVSSMDAIFIAMKEYCQRNDPLEKAKRAEKRQQMSASASVTSETPTETRKKRARHRPAVVEHVVNLRDTCQCAHVDSNGNRCSERRWLNKHHIVEFAEGGDHSPENLETLCWGHHKIKHLKASRDAMMSQV